MSNPMHASATPSVEGVVTRPSPYSVPQTLERLKASIQNHHLSVFAQIDHSDEAKRVGLTMPEAHLLIFGSPRAGTPLMVATPLLALELPLKALVWQDADDQVWVSYDSSAYLAQRFAIPAELAKNIAGIDGVVASALQS
jgi:uncharacterized protein (DUF302 family)